MKLRHLIILSLGSLMMLSLGSAFAQVTTSAQSQGQNVELVGQLGGSVEGVAVQGTYAYIGVGPRLFIINITDPTSPTVVGKTQPLPDIVKSLAVVGNYAYVADGEGGLRIINVSNPATPFEVGYYDTAGQALSVAVSGNYAYVADDDQGLRIINISSPASPFEAGFYNPSGLGYWAYTVKVASNYAYVGGVDGLHSIHVSNPANPTQVGFYEILGGSNGVSLVGNYAYVADGNLLRIISIADPTNLTQTAFYDPPGLESPYTVFVSGNYAYLGIGDSGVRVVNVSNPFNPTGAGNYNTPGYAWELAVAGNYAFVADGLSGLCIINVSDPMIPSLAGSYGVVLGSAHEVAAMGNYAYTTQWQGGGLHIIDASNPAYLNQTAVFNLPTYAEGVAVSGHTAFAVHWNVLSSRLRSIDVSNPASPVAGGYDDFLPGATGVTAAGNYVYVADGYGLRIYNATTPETPLLVGVYTDTQVSGSPMGVTVAGPYAYVADAAGLLIVNVTDPAHPTYAGFYDSPGYTYAVAVENSYAYLADGSNLRIIDISSKANPTLAGSYNVLPGTATRVVVVNGYAYVSTGVGLLVVNVSDPAHPTQAGYYDTPGWSEGVAVVGNRIYVACGDGGLLVLRFRYAPTSATIPTSGGTFTSNGDHTTYTFPPSTFTDTVIITHTARASSDAPSLNTLAGIDHFFDVTAVYSSTNLPAQPAASHTYTVAVEYTDAEKGPVIEETLGLYWWSGSAWSQQGISSTVNITDNVVIAQVDHLSLFAVLGETHRVYLPIVMRNH